MPPPMSSRKPQGPLEVSSIQTHFMQVPTEQEPKVARAPTMTGPSWVPAKSQQTGGLDGFFGPPRKQEPNLLGRGSMHSSATSRMATEHSELEKALYGLGPSPSKQSAPAANGHKELLMPLNTFDVKDELNQIKNTRIYFTVAMMVSFRPPNLPRDNCAASRCCLATGRHR